MIGNKFKESYIKIDKKNSVQYHDDLSMLNIKINLYEFLSNYESDHSEIEIYRRFLTFLVPNWDKDQSKLSIEVSKLMGGSNYKSKAKLKTISKSYGEDGDCDDILTMIGERNYDNEFYFFNSHVQELSTVLAHTYKNILKTHNIKNTPDFVKLYRHTSVNLDSSIYSSSGSFLSTKNSSHSTKNLNTFPVDFLYLTTIYKSIHSLKFFIPNKDFLVYQYLIILINLSWLFPNITEVEIELETTLDYKITYKDYEEFIKENTNKFYLMLIIAYYVAKLNGLKSFKLKIPESYENEFGYLLFNIQPNLIVYSNSSSNKN